MSHLKKLFVAIAVGLIVMAANSVDAQEPAEASPSDRIPLSNSPSYELPPPLTFAQQKARFQEEQRMLRMEWNKWIGYSPSRPNMNASYMSNGLQRYYIPSRGVIVTGYNHSGWYW